MKRTGLYITLAAVTLMWATPAACMADTVSEAPTEIISVIEAPQADAAEKAEEEALAATTGPEIEVQMALAEAQAQAEAEAQARKAQEANAALRQQVVDYALQFVGGRYVAGGNDPHTGADCSGFTRYVMQHAAGVNLNRSSVSQATQGVQVSADQMRPGDLIFYANGSKINHVALYIGDGQIVHASTYKTGIKISQWNYRTPVKIVNVLG